MRRVALVLSTMALVLLLASGMALAVINVGGPGPDALRGTNDRDWLEGGGGPDSLLGLGAGDCLSGGTGADLVADGENHRGATDVIYGGGGDDLMLPRNEPGGREVVSCGAGRDRVFADRKDEISGGCERVRFRSPTNAEVIAFISGG